MTKNKKHSINKNKISKRNTKRKIKRYERKISGGMNREERFNPRLDDDMAKRFNPRLTPRLVDDMNNVLKSKIAESRPRKVLNFPWRANLADTSADVSSANVNIPREFPYNLAAGLLSTYQMYQKHKNEAHAKKIKAFNKKLPKMHDRIIW